MKLYSTVLTRLLTIGVFSLSLVLGGGPGLAQATTCTPGPGCLPIFIPIVPPPPSGQVTLTTSPTSTYAVISPLISETAQGQATNNADVAAAVAHLAPIYVNATNGSTTSFAKVRIPPVTGAAPHVQLWAQDSNGNWFDTAVSGYGDPTNGFPFPSGYSATTSVYAISDTAGTYHPVVSLIDLNNNNAVLASTTGTITVIPPQSTSTIIVNQQWTGTATNSPETYSGNTYYYGINAFSTIQSGVNAAGNGSNVIVLAGNYTEDVSVPTSITLTGADKTTTTINGMMAINAASTTVSGFTVTRPANNTAAYIPADSYGIFINGVSNITISGNAFSGIGTTSSVTGHAYGVYYQGKSTTDASNVSIKNNSFSQVGNTGAQSSAGIGILDSHGSENLSNFVIDTNAISGVASSRGAYGIILNHASGAGANTGSTTNAQITNNTISLLNGQWAHGIGLEGTTPNALITGNTISHLTATGIDAAGIHFDTNSSSASVDIENNTLDTTTMTFGVTSSVPTTIDASLNYWATGSTSPALKAGSIGGAINSSPWFTNAAFTTFMFNTVASSTASTTSATIANDVDINEGDIATSTPIASFVIPAGTTLSASSSWDGSMVVPTLVSNSSVTITPDANTTASAIEAIQIGNATTSVSLDHAARILFPGQANQLVGYSRNGVFTPINTTCVSDDQTGGDALAANGSCKTNSGADLVVWTKQLGGTFVIYNETNNQQQSGGGGGGGGVISGPLSVGSNNTGNTTSNTGGTTGTGTGSGTTNNTGTGTNTGGNGQVLGAAAYNFTVDLHVGSTGPDVTALQNLLTADGFYSGPVTGYFGNLTKAAVKRFQKAHNLPQTGYVGPLTRAVLNQGVVPTSETTSKHVFSVNLHLGSRGSEVTALQNLLTAKGMYTSPVTGYFGSFTLSAVKRFQKANNLPQTGYVGPLTRAVLNQG